MTLNITVLTPGNVFQSSDHRLWDIDARKLVTDSSNKSVLWRSLDWTAMITYTGVGRVASKDTSDLVADWLIGKTVETYQELIATLRDAAEPWLVRIMRSTGELWPHTFVVAGFVDRIPTATLISNFERVRKKPLSTPAEHLMVSTVSTRCEPVVLVTGAASSVTSRPLRARLGGLSSLHSDEPARVRVAIKALNALAAKRPGVRSTISEACYVQSLDPNGTWFAEDSTAPPRTILDGTDIEAIARAFLDRTFPQGVRYMGGAGISFGADSHPPHAVCNPGISSKADQNDWSLRELTKPALGSAWAKAANCFGKVCGSYSAAPRKPSSPCWWTPDGELVPLAIDGISGDAVGVMADGTVVGNIQDVIGYIHAVLWSVTGDKQVLDVASVVQSSVSGVNESGRLCGWVSFHETDRSQKAYRPARWTSDGEVEVLRVLADGHWGVAVAINPLGVAAVTIHRREHDLAPRTLLWHPNGDLEDVSPVTGGASVCGIDSAGNIVASIRDSTGDTLAALWRRGYGWEPLGTPSGWYPTAVADDGCVAGWATIDGWKRPWIMDTHRYAALIPHFRHHGSVIQRFATGSELMCGHAATDHGSHAVLWRRNSQPVPEC